MDIEKKTKAQIVTEYETLKNNIKVLKQRSDGFEKECSYYKDMAEKKEEEFLIMQEDLKEQIADLIEQIENPETEEETGEKPYIEYSEEELIIRLRADRDKEAAKIAKLKKKVKKLKKKLK